jgi:hypothetical protein
MRRKSSIAAAAVAGIAILAGGTASAVTIDFGTQAGNFTPYIEDGFSFDRGNLTNGGCPADPSCLLLSPGNPSVTMTAEDGSLFDLLGFSYHFVGDGEQQRGTLTVSDGTSLTFTQTEFGNDPFTITAADLGDAFLGVSAITFTMAGPGADRLDNIVAEGGTTVIPLPASLTLLAGALAGFGFLTRRRSKAGPA